MTVTSGIRYFNNLWEKMIYAIAFGKGKHYLLVAFLWLEGNNDYRFVTLFP